MLLTRRLIQAQEFDRWAKDACDTARDELFGNTLEDVSNFRSKLDDNESQAKATADEKKVTQKESSAGEMRAEEVWCRLPWMHWMLS